MRSRIALALAAGLVVSACSDQQTPVSPGPEASTSEARPGGPPAAQQAEPFVPGRVLVRFRPGAAAGAITAGMGAQIERPLVLGIQVLSVPAGAEQRVIEALSRNPNVDFAEPDWIRTFGDPAVMPVDDPFIGYKWDLDNDGNIYASNGDVLASTGGADADMDWREAVGAIGTAGGTARIGIMDTGVRNDHDELEGRIAVQYDFFDDDSNAEDDNGHGTHVAGIAAARTDNGVGVAGVAFTGNVDFAIAKVCGPTGWGPFVSYGCPTSAIAEGITWAVDNGAHVLNLSLGGGSGSTSTREALQYARANDVLPFCAAGNESGPVSYPGAWPECVAVSATDWSDNLASYSNSGPEVELSAPGGDDEHPDGYSYILSAYNEGPSSYAFIAGTSMASPQAAGLGALLHVLGVTDDGDKLSRMKNSADDRGATGTDNQFGAGRINVHAAVQEPGGGGGNENEAPTASFTVDCSDLTCSFDGTGSSDPDGDPLGYSWDFGDGATDTGATTSHTYASGDTYTVTLTVSDGDLSDSESQNVTVTEPPSGGITLDATGYKVRGRHTIDLEWLGANSSVDIFVNGTFQRTESGTTYTYSTDNRGSGSYTFMVCEAGTSTCSNEVTVTF